MKEEEIGKFMKDQLSGLQQTPPEGMWASISQDASLQKFNRGRRIRRIATRIVLPIAATLIVATTALVVFHSTRQNNDVLQTRSNQSNISAQNNITNDTPSQTATISQNNTISTPRAVTKEVLTTNDMEIPQLHPTETVTAAVEVPNNPTPQPSSHPVVLVSEQKSHQTGDETTVQQPGSTLKDAKVSERKPNVTTESTSHNKAEKSGMLRFSHDTLVCRNSKVTLFVENASEVRWSTGTFEPTLDIIPDEPTVLYANVVTQDKVDTTIYIHVNIYDCDLFVPTAFTPNGDGLNDEFLVHAPMNFTGYECVIFDRQGRTLFQSKSIYYGWDGTFEGKPIPPGAYFYAITYLDELNEKHVKKGQIVLIR